jgi:hypothetical protein
MRISKNEKTLPDHRAAFCVNFGLLAPKSRRNWAVFDHFIRPGSRRRFEQVLEGTD